jgi:hypothetical protein
MTRDRPGRPQAAADARLHLAVAAGWRFDPAVARAFLGQLQEESERRFTRVVPPAQGW